MARRAIHNDAVEVKGEIVRQTDKAILFYDGRVDAWLPLSQVEVADDRRSILVPEWLAKDKGLI